MSGDAHAPVDAANPVDALVARMEAQRVVPVLRGDDPGSVAQDVDRLVAAGLQIVELTATIPGWEALLERVGSEHPSVTFGVGTLTTAHDAARACEAGAGFLVSPYPADEVREVADQSGVPFIAGGFSPGEVAAAARHGAAKLFPAHVGGPRYLKSLKAVLPGARIMPTGGITLGEVADWLAAGAFAVGIGGDLAAASDLEGVLADLQQP